MLPDMRDRDGNPAHAVFGFARFLGDLIERVRPAYMAVAFDARRQFGYHDIERHFGVRPERFADYLALTGDEVDNIPGVPGIGHRTAASLMKAFDSLDEMYADLSRVAGLKLRGAGSLGVR